jgi:hypothetical protein
MRPTTPRKKSVQRSSRKSSKTPRKASTTPRRASKSPNYRTLTSNIPLKRKRTPTRSVKRRSRKSSRVKSTDSFEVLPKSEKKESKVREKFQIISNEVEIDEDMILEFKNRSAMFKTDYLIFGIIGTQSTGKSTLLNHLFNCTFDMLNAKQGRKQTTKGVWGSFINENRMLVLDIEGSDSMERSMVDQNAENKICTFGLIMTHVLLSIFYFFGDFILFVEKYDFFVIIFLLDNASFIMGEYPFIMGYYSVVKNYKFFQKYQFFLDYPFFSKLLPFPKLL